MAPRRTQSDRKRSTRFVKGGPAIPNDAPVRTNRKRSVVKKSVVKKSGVKKTATVTNGASPKDSTAPTRTKTKARNGNATGSTWKELERDNQRAQRRRIQRPTLMGSLSTLRFAMTVLAVAAVFTAYVGHVYATQELVQDVQRLTKERMELELEFNRVRGEYDRVTGHDDIYERARELGFREAVAMGTPLEVAP